MNPDIWVVRDGDSYRLLHGHLHLAIEMAKQTDVYVDIKNEGMARIVKTSDGYAVEHDCRRDRLNQVARHP
jgi:hypothetical protein